MSLKNIKNKLLSEFEKIKQGKNPKITADVEAVVVLSGESRDPAIKIDLHDTEERLAEGIRIYNEIKKQGSPPTLIVNGTDPQNIFMKNESRKQRIGKIVTMKNPPYPKASTKTQFEAIEHLKFKKMAIVIHAAYGPRTRRYIDKFMNGREVLLFLIGRDKMRKSEIEIEIEKIQKYFPFEFKDK